MRFPSSSCSVASCVAFVPLLFTVACGSSSSNAPPGAQQDAGAGDADLDAAPGYVDAAAPAEAGHPDPIDGAYVTPDGGSIAADRFVTKVVSFTPGACAGFGKSRMPDVVYGPPVGAGDTEGGLDVVSLGAGGEIVLSFEPNAIVDGPGVDLLVFENAFFAAGDPQSVAADLGEVSVSDDGVTWTTFDCTATQYPYGACAGWHPVYSNPTNGISPLDPKTAGGDPFDLHDVGVARARFVRVRDKSGQACPSGSKVTTDGFDLDAMAIVNAATP